MKKNDLYFILFGTFLGGAVYLGYSNFEFVYKITGLVFLAIAMVGSFLLTKIGGRAVEYYKGARAEMRKVVWPKQNEVIQTAIMVFILVLLFALILWLMDTLFYFLMGLIIK